MSKRIEAAKVVRKDPKVKATFVMRVEYKEMDSIHTILDDIIEIARQYGHVTKATLEVITPCIEELV